VKFVFRNLLAAPVSDPARSDGSLHPKNLVGRSCCFASVTGPLRRLSLLLLLVLLLPLAPTNTQAWSVYNNSTRTVRARVLQGDWDVEISPGGNSACHWSNTGCNPSGSQTAVVSLQIETLDGDPRKFSHIVSMEAGGIGVVVEEARPTSWNSPGHLVLWGYRTNGDLLGQSPPNTLGVSLRDVRFLISADCQFCDLSDCPGTEMQTWNMNSTLLNIHMLSRVSGDATLRGLCYAGDLTQFASSAELDTYKASIAGFTRYVYDGLGNHDLEYGRTRVREYVRERKRTTVRAQDGDPHYSWDWHDVHMVQLNLMPANEKAPDTSEVNNEYNDPMAALAFLIFDLALHVGNSGRPVILMHHYGFESFSANGWWTAAQRLAYWNAIANYNVVGIFTGHLHPGPQAVDSSQRFVTWNRPNGTMAGPASIPTFVSGTAREGAYLEVTYNNANQLRVQVRNQSGTVTGTRCYLRPTPIWVAPTSPLAGRGWKDDPYVSVSDALDAAAQRINDVACSSPVADIRVKAGNYSAGARMGTPARLTLEDGGTARIAR
jgi:hypothetical protein